MIREENFDIDERLKLYGRMSGWWYCENCKSGMSSFLYNWEYHIPEICPECNKGNMVEEQEKREKPIKFNFIDKNKEKNWANGKTIAQQSAILGSEQINPY